MTKQQIQAMHIEINNARAKFKKEIAELKVDTSNLMPIKRDFKYKSNTL